MLCVQVPSRLTFCPPHTSSHPFRTKWARGNAGRSIFSLRGMWWCTRHIWGHVTDITFANTNTEHFPFSVNLHWHVFPDNLNILPKVSQGRESRVCQLTSSIHTNGVGSETATNKRESLHPQGPRSPEEAQKHSDVNGAPRAMKQGNMNLTQIWQEEREMRCGINPYLEHDFFILRTFSIVPKNVK